MNQKSNSLIAQYLADPAVLEAVIGKAVREAVLTHARAGRPVATWRDGKVVWLQPDEVFALLAQESARPSPTKEKEPGGNGEKQPKSPM